VAVVALVVSLLVLLRGVGLLGSWTQMYEPEGRFVVEACGESGGRVGARAVCSGKLVLDRGRGADVVSTLVGPKSSFGTTMPDAGTEVDAYYRAGDTSRSFPEEARPRELARVLVGLIPFVFLVVGFSCWLLGWALTGGANAAERERNANRYPFPGRFALRGRGVAWAVVGLAWLAFDRFLVGDLLGTAGLG
jgi:hypothetical protein